MTVRRLSEGMGFGTWLSALLVLSGCALVNSKGQGETRGKEGSSVTESQSEAGSALKDSDDVMRTAKERADKYVAEQANRSTRIKYRPVLALVEDRGDRIVFNYRMVPDIKVFETHTDITLSYDKATGELSLLRSIHASRGRLIDQ